MTTLKTGITTRITRANAQIDEMETTVNQLAEKNKKENDKAKKRLRDSIIFNLQRKIEHKTKKINELENQLAILQEI